jgi:hypothetical protein
MRIPIQGFMGLASKRRLYKEVISSRTVNKQLTEFICTVELRLGI